jgi:hypothetical protein
MRKLISTTLLALAASFLSAQECAVLNQDVKIMGLERRMSFDLDDIDPVTVPVVFHVVYNPAVPESNISDEQVISQIAALDSGFRYTGLDTKIQFCLASRDPQGNPTSGITRHNGVDLFGQVYGENGVAVSGLDDGVNDLTMKQTVGCWDTDRYLNFYIVSEINGNNAGGGIQGYAYLPPTPTQNCLDGIVVLYNVTGTTGTRKPSRQKGYTGVHEAGHYLGLLHTFDNTFSCADENNCETQGDRVCDTPPTVVGSTCLSTACDGALVDNFMEYTSETCKSTFTLGQAERMHNAILTYRPELVDNFSCLPAVDYDVAIDQVFYDENWCTDEQDIWVTVSNTGSEPISYVDVQIFCNGQEYVETAYDLDQGASVAVLVPQVYVGGANSFEINLLTPEDEYADNNSGVYPISDTGGELLEVYIHPGFFASESSWDIQDDNGEVLFSGGGYTAGCDQEYTEINCIDAGCYTFNFYDESGDGVVYCGGDQTVLVNGDTLINIPTETEAFVVSQEFCASSAEPACEYDYDANGAIGNGDILVMITEFGCSQDCQYDANGDGTVNVLDVLYILTLIGDCPVEADVNLLLKDLTGQSTTVNSSAASQNNSAGLTIYDISGRIVSRPIFNLASGIYIIKTSDGVKKIFVQ